MFGLKSFPEVHRRVTTRTVPLLFTLARSFEQAKSLSMYRMRKTRALRSPNQPLLPCKTAGPELLEARNLQQRTRLPVPVFHNRFRLAM
jgi:hypothetical protein